MQVSPALALAIGQRFPSIASLRKELRRNVRAHAADSEVQALPSAALVLAAAASDGGVPSEELQHLASWQAAHAFEGLELLSSSAGTEGPVRQYAIRCVIQLWYFFTVFVVHITY